MKLRFCASGVFRFLASWFPNWDAAETCFRLNRPARVRILARKQIFPVSNEPIPTNPLREGLSSRPMPQPCNVVIFGASGDLTFRKLIPALYNLAADGDLPASTNIVGFARREKTDESWRAELRDSTEK